MTRIRKKTCHICSHASPVLFRVKYEKAGDWVFVCPQCWQKISPDNPDYVYGGTWKARK